MKRIALVPVILLAGSLLVLAALFIIRGVNSRRMLAQSQQTQTVVVATQQAEQTAAAIPTETPIPTDTPTPEPTATASPPTDTPEATATKQGSRSSPGCDKAGFVEDITIPDGRRFKKDKNFTKTWRIINNGTCTWDSSYTLYFVSGDRMSGPTSQPLVSFEVPPGKIIDVSVDLKSPKEVGTYKGYWAFRNADGVAFGVGNGDNPIYVEIEVFKP